MSKIGRKPILLGSAKASFDSRKVVIKGKNETFEHCLPDCLSIVIDEKIIMLELKEKSRKNSALWGLHRALLANKVQGVEKDFEKKVTLVGLGYKAVLSGKKLVFSLGYTNKIEYALPEKVTVVIDKSGQVLLFKSSDKFVLGNVCDFVRSLRRPEPYKGKGIFREGDVIVRKAGKTKGG